MSEDSGVTRRLGRGRQWISRRSHDVLAGSRTVADESDRWFLSALRGLEHGAAQAQGSADALASALAARWARVRPRWMRRRTPRERIESMLRAEGKRQGFDVKQEEFREFSEKMAILLELVYVGALPLHDIAFEPASDDASDDVGTFSDTSAELAACDESISPAPEETPRPTPASADR